MSDKITLLYNVQNEVTVLPNKFIDEYMIKADGEYVKIYLLILRLQGMGLPVDVERIADHLELTRKDVLRALSYWEKAGILQTGKKRLVTVKNKQYYAAKNGKALSGIYYIKNKFYAFNKNGACNQKKTKKLKAAAKYNKNFKKLKKLLGKPKKTKYESYSCYGPGNDGYIKYANFTVYVYKYKGKVLYMGAE